MIIILHLERIPKNLKSQEPFSSLRIVTGTLKGRLIPSQTLGDVRLTPSRIKESIFNIIGTDLTGLRFLDLCAGSGQIGLEALSRGANVVFNEPDKKRYKILNDLLENWGLQSEIFNQTGQNFIQMMNNATHVFDLVYLDPPYNAEENGNPLVTHLLNLLSRSRLIACTGGHIIAQHSNKVSIQTQSDFLICKETRHYGGSTLKIYSTS